MDGMYARSSAIAAHLATSRALQTQLSGVDPDVAEGSLRLEKTRAGLTLSLLTMGMVVAV